jgi:hypothetical protein
MSALASLLPELLLEPTGDEKLRSEDNDLASSLLAPAFVLKAGQTPAFFLRRPLLIRSLFLLIARLNAHHRKTRLAISLQR